MPDYYLPGPPATEREWTRLDEVVLVDGRLEPGGLMKILVSHPLSPCLVEPGLGDLVSYRPELATGSASAWTDSLRELQPDALLVAGQLPNADALAVWSQGAAHARQLIYRPEGKEVASTGLLTSGPAASAGFLDIEDIGDIGGIEAHQIGFLGCRSQDDLRALGLAERQAQRLRTEKRLASVGLAGGSYRNLSSSRVTLVGAGIVNLMIALDLADRGAWVEVLEASPDPRTRPPWHRLGATHGGGDARTFSFTEADNYNTKGHWGLRRTISAGGWLAVEPETLGGAERAWLDRFYALPRWRAEVFAEDIHGFNRDSYPLWEKLRQRKPHLFDAVGFKQGVLRLYSERQKVEEAEALHAKLGSLLRTFDADELRRRHPGCAAAVESGSIAGALEVRGFSLNIHAFVGRLLEHLETRGVHFHWEQRVRAIERAGDGRVTSLVTSGGKVRSEHYVLSPGVHGQELLRGTRSAGKLQGILGLWLTLPNLEPRLEQSIKLCREGHVGEDSNITLASDEAGRPALILGSGYGYLGTQPLDPDSPEVGRLFEALVETASRYFPRAHAQALLESGFERSRRACVRPFTATGLGVLEALGTVEEGCMVIASGHNTGGFTQAPVVAHSVAATLEGRPHRMQSLYDPERGISPGS